ncbi:MAG TPA: family 20 glycosylhydrolase [Acidimicrobiales bacterium]|nr:family 20 glycosylhydrolase [Acidimicrobiales bacterium]
MAPEPTLLPRPRSYQGDPEGRRVPDREPVEHLDAALPAQGYRLEVTEGAVRVVGGDEAGLRHGRATLAQLRHPANAAHRPGDRTIAACRIEDWPDFAVRGVMLDVSRDRVPSMQTLRDLVDRLAGWKINQLQLYMEHTFAYAGHEDVWRHADPYSGDDMRALDDHCRSRGVELVANQNTLGHFERWLRLDRYRPLAIAPDGFDWIMGIHRPPLTLDPANPDAFALVSDLLAQLVPHLRSTRVHVGMDEPWELSSERRGEWVQWLRALRDLPVLAGRELLVWGDVPAAHGDLLAQLPGGVTVCEWGYEDNHPFDQRTARLEHAGVPFWVCPGTSSWMSLSGRVDNMIGNIEAAATAGVAHGAGGLLVTDWGDMGHHQQPYVSDPGFATAAAFGWCVDSHTGLESGALATLLDVHCYDDPAQEMGRAVVGLGHACRMVGPQLPNMSALALPFLLPQWPMGKAMTKGLTAADLQAVQSLLDDTTAALGRARPRRPDGQLVVEEIASTAALLHLACRDAGFRLQGDGTLGSVAPSDRDTLATELGDRIEEYRRLWLERFRPGGLSDSTAWFQHLLGCYRTGTTDPSWFGPFG